MSRWFRVYDDLVDDPKVQRMPATLFKVWVNLLCIASKNGGELPPISDVSFTLRADAKTATAWLKELQSRGLVDDVDGKLSPHNWGARQFKSDADPTASERQVRKRARDAAAHGDSHVTRDATVTSRVTTDVDARDVTPSRDRDRDRAEEETEKDARFRAFARFWNVWPNRVGRPAAERAFAKVVGEADAIIAGVVAYMRDKPPDRPWLNPATFLNQRRWEDAPAALLPATRPAVVARPSFIRTLQELDLGEPACDAQPYDIDLAPNPTGA